MKETKKRPGNNLTRSKRTLDCQNLVVSTGGLNGGFRSGLSGGFSGERFFGVADFAADFSNGVHDLYLSPQTPRNSQLLCRQFCHTGVDQITTKGAGGSTHCQDNMLPRRECFLRIERALHRFCHKPSEGLARSVVLSHHSRAWCYVPC